VECILNSLINSSAGTVTPSTSTEPVPASLSTVCLSVCLSVCLCVCGCGPGSSYPVTSTIPPALSTHLQFINSSLVFKYLNPWLPIHSSPDRLLSSRVMSHSRPLSSVLALERFWCFNICLMAFFFCSTVPCLVVRLPAGPPPCRSVYRPCLPCHRVLPRSLVKTPCPFTYAVSFYPRVL